MSLNSVILVTPDEIFDNFVNIKITLLWIMTLRACRASIDVTCKKYFLHYGQTFFFKKNTLLYGPFLWMGFNCLKATEPLRGDSLLFTIQFPGVPGAQLIDLGRMKG